MVYKHPVCYICKKPVNLLSYATGDKGKPVAYYCAKTKRIRKV